MYTYVKIRRNKRETRNDVANPINHPWLMYIAKHAKIGEYLNVHTKQFLEETQK